MKKKLQLKVNFVKFTRKIAMLLLLLTLSMQVTAKGLPANSSALVAQIKENRVTIKMQNASLKAILFEINKQTKINFVYNENELKSFPTKTVNVSNVTVEKVLTDLLEGTDYTYKVTGNNVSIIKRAPQATTSVGKEINVHGKVIDENKKPILGATVILSGTPKGAITDNEGNFIIKATEGDVLDISYVGYLDKKIPVKTASANNLIVSMAIDALTVEEIVVDGYMETNRKRATGSTSIIKGADLLSTGTETPEQMLQGKVAGLVVTNMDGMVGKRQQVRVRGTSSILGNQEPIWVVDGMIQEDPLPFKTQELGALGQINSDNFDMIKDFVGSSIAWLNPADIEDITVLKDASATVLYGVKAANGVIVIRTKKGKSGRMSISYSGKIAVSSKTTYDKLGMMNSKERIDVSREVIDRGLINGSDLPDVGYEGLYKKYINNLVSYDEFINQVNYLETVNTDWFDILFRNALSHDHSVRVSGGSDRFTYTTSLGVNSVKGTAKGNDKTSYSANISISTWLVEDKLKLDARLSGNKSEASAFYQVNPYSYASTINRSFPSENPDGTLYYYPYLTSGFQYNILNELNNTGNSNETSTINGAFNLGWDIVKGLKFTSALGFGYQTVDGQSFATERSYYITNLRKYEYGAYMPSDPEYKISQLPHGGELNSTVNKNFNYSWKNQLDYNHVFEGGHRFNVMFVQEVRSTQYDGYSNTLYGYVPDRGKTVMMPPAMILSGKTPIANPIYKNYKNILTDNNSNTLSFLGNAGYSYKERYILSLSARTDASNKFGENKASRRLPVWSIGGRWNMTEESWMKKQKLFNELSFRVSYGWQGNVAENFGPDLIAKIPPTSIDYLTGEYLLAIHSLPYPDLRWEKTKTYNLGFDMGFLKNRLMTSLNYYMKHSVDLITMTAIPTEYGMSSMPVNSGDMTNSGFELTVTATPVRTDKFVWSIGFNMAKNFNELKSKIDTNYGWKSAANGTLLKEGYAYSSFWAFNFAGLNHEQGYPEFYFPEGLTEEQINDPTNWMAYAGKLEQPFTGGLSTSLRYRSLSFSASFNVGIGGQKFLAPIFEREVSGTPNAYYNLKSEMNNRWRKPGDEKHTMIPSLPYNGVPGVQLPHAGQSGGVKTETRSALYDKIQDRVVSASFLRCNNMELRYNLNEDLLKKVKLKGIALSFGVSNPFIIVSKDFKGQDPEVATGNQPISQTYSFGVSLTL